MIARMPVREWVMRAADGWASSRRFGPAAGIGMLLMLLHAAVVLADPVPATLRDFHVSGTQVGDANPASFQSPQVCSGCHSGTETTAEPFASWKGSLMANAGRDPLFFAQLATANQDVANVGYFCLRCHVPNAVVSGNALVADGSTLNARDEDGVDCHFCHAMVNPDYQAGVSPPRDLEVLGALESIPAHTGNAMFVLDPDGVRRGPRTDAAPSHELLVSPYHRSASLCGTCHDVGNVAVSRQEDGSYAYNALDTPVENEDLATHFPLERTYTEWKLSSFADGGVVHRDQSIAQALREAFKYPSFRLLMAGYFVCGFQVVFIGVHMPSYLKDKGLSPQVASYALALIGLFNVFGTYAAGVLGQKLAKRKILAFIYLARAVAITVFLLAPLTPVSVYIFASVMGLLWLSTVPPTNAIVAQIFGVAHLSMLGGFVFFSHQIGSFMGVWLGGVLYDRTGSYDIVWVLAIALGVLAGLINLPVREHPIARGGAALAA
jgi:hypothetical protein